MPLLTLAITVAMEAQNVIDAAQKAEPKAMKAAGAKIRRKARDLLRRRKGPSAPGEPPSHHATNQRYSLKWILFDWEANNRTLVVGPVLNRSAARGSAANNTVPQVHEHGGRGTWRQMRLPTIDTRKQGSQYGPEDWRPYRARTIKKLQRYNTPYEVREVSAQFPARPFMLRALQIEAARGTIPAGWAGQIQG